MSYISKEGQTGKNSDFPGEDVVKTHQTIEIQLVWPRLKQVWSFPSKQRHPPPEVQMREQVISNWWCEHISESSCWRQKESASLWGYHGGFDVKKATERFHQDQVAKSQEWGRFTRNLHTSTTDPSCNVSTSTPLLRKINIRLTWDNEGTLTVYYR